MYKRGGGAGDWCCGVEAVVRVSVVDGWDDSLLMLRRENRDFLAGGVSMGQSDDFV